LICGTFEKSARIVFCVVKQGGCAQFMHTSRFDGNNLVATEARLVNFFSVIFLHQIT